MSYSWAQCRNCGAYTALPAENCRRCGAPFDQADQPEEHNLQIVPEELPAPVVPLLGELTGVKAFSIGLAAGIIPLGLAALISGGGAVFFTGWALLVILSIGAAVCISKRRWRFLGYGLVVMACVSPVVAFIGCLAALSNTPI